MRGTVRRHRKQNVVVLVSPRRHPLKTPTDHGDTDNHRNECGHHTLDHIGAVLETVDGLGSFARNLDAVKLAVWLRDVIYVSRASNNEERSAEFAERLCDRFSIPDGRVVSSLILKTKSHEADGDPDAQVLLDADLAILGASELAYRNYADQIRQEYAWVPEPDYCKGRQHVLERFLARPRIFHLLTDLEETARRNIADEINPLRARGNSGNTTAPAS